MPKDQITDKNLLKKIAIQWSELLTKTDAADLFCVSVKTIDRLRQKGELAYSPGHPVRIPADQITDYNRAKIMGRINASFPQLFANRFWYYEIQWSVRGPSKNVSTPKKDACKAVMALAGFILEKGEAE